MLIDPIGDGSRLAAAACGDWAALVADAGWEFCAVKGIATAQMMTRTALYTHQRFIMPPEQDDNSKL